MRREKIPNLKIEKDFLLSYIRCYRSRFLKISFLLRGENHLIIKK
jgi:hypothetical protein